MTSPASRSRRKSNSQKRSQEPIRVQLRKPGSEQLIFNRLAAILEHIQPYYFGGPAKLARDAGVSCSAVCRLMNGKTSPSYHIVCKLAAAIERRLGRRVDPRDLVCLDGQHPTPSVCQLCGCQGCLPTAHYGADDQVQPTQADLQAGQWSLRASRLGNEYHSTREEGL